MRVIPLFLVSCAVTALGAQTKAPADPKPSAAIILSLNDVAGFSGGQDLALDADGNLFVRTAGPNPEETSSRFGEARYYMKLSRAEISGLIALVKASGITQYRGRQRNGVPDEARPGIKVTLPGEKAFDVAKWANDKDSNFDKLYDRLLERTRSLCGTTTAAWRLKPSTAAHSGEDLSSIASESIGSPARSSIASCSERPDYG